MRAPAAVLGIMASLLRKAARMNLVAIDYVLQVTVVELILGALDAKTMLSFELSRGTKASSPKLVEPRPLSDVCVGTAGCSRSVSQHGQQIWTQTFFILMLVATYAVQPPGQWPI